MMEVKRGQIWYCDFGSVIGSEQGGVRPCVIVQNNTGNLFSPTTIVCPTTTKNKASLPTHVLTNQLGKTSIIMCEQMKVVDRSRLLSLVGEITAEEEVKLNRAIRISVGV